MANGKKLSVFGGRSSSGSVPVARSAPYRPPAPRCGCGATGIKASGLRFIETSWTMSRVDGVEVRQYGFEWQCAKCRQLPCPF